MGRKEDKSVKMLQDFVRNPHNLMRRQVQMIQRFDTPDSRLLGKKLDDDQVELLVKKAIPIVESQGLFLPYDKVDLPELGKQLKILLHIQLQKNDIASFAKDYREFIEERYTTERLNWLWSFSWTYLIWGSDIYSREHYQLYGAMLGPSPLRGRNAPWQAVLNYVRKYRVKDKERHFINLCKVGNIQELMEMGLDEDEAQGFIDKMARVSV